MDEILDALNSICDEIRELNGALQDIRGDILEILGIGSNSSIADLYDKLDNISDDISSMKSDVDSIQSNVNSMESDIRTIKSDVSSIESDIDTIKSDVSSIEYEMD